MESFLYEYVTSSLTNTTATTPKHHPPYPTYVGYICALVAVVFYGSNFVPVKKYYTGDGKLL